MQTVYISAIVASLHFLALAIGLSSVFLRGRALNDPLDDRGFERLFYADTTWGIAAALWLGTGLLRAFAGLEKGSEFYLSSALFMLKMGLFLTVVALEIWPMLTFIRWRTARRRGQPIDTSIKSRLHIVNHIQLALVVVMVFVASLMARGVGM